MSKKINPLAPQEGKQAIAAAMNVDVMIYGGSANFYL